MDNRNSVRAGSSNSLLASVCLEGFTCWNCISSPQTESPVRGCYRFQRAVRKLPSSKAVDRRPNSPEELIMALCGIDDVGDEPAGIFLFPSQNDWSAQFGGARRKLVDVARIGWGVDSEREQWISHIQMTTPF